MTSPNLRVERVMSGPETMMWHIDRDPLLATSGAGVSIFEGQLDAERFRRRMANIVASVKRLRQHVGPGAGPLVPPRWTFDRDLDLDWHIRRIGAPGDGSVRAVLDWATQYFQDPLDRTRPLWQYVVVERMAEGRSALAVKIHHVVADGAAFLELTHGYIDASAAGPEDGEPAPIDLDAVVQASLADPEDTEPGLVGNAIGLMAGLARAPVDVTRRAVEALTHPQRLDQAGDETADLLRMVIDQLHLAGSTLWRERSRRRRFEALSIPLGETRQAGKVLGGTVNDVFVTGAVEGSSRYHRLLGADPDRFHVTFVVSTRGDASGTNAFTPVPVELPAAAMPLRERFAAVHDRLKRRRDEGPRPRPDGGRGFRGQPVADGARRRHGPQPGRPHRLRHVQHPRLQRRDLDRGRPHDAQLRLRPSGRHGLQPDGGLRRARP